jgi:hypothetical protein
VKQVFAILGISILVTDISGQIDSMKNRNDTLPEKVYILHKVERDGVTLPEVELNEVTVIGKPGVAARREYRRNERLIYNIKRVYPYAVMVRMRLNQVNDDLKSITDERERKSYLKNVEKNVFAEYEDDIRDMTITQGRLLIKLIDRETQNTSFNLIRDFRGKFTAAFWQGIARIFGSNLKEEYDRNGDDAMIELIINEIDAGRL